MSLEPFLYLLSNYDPNEPSLPPTTLYNEGWLLRLVVDWFSNSGITNHPLSFPKDGHWFSEARLPSAFLPRSRGDPLAELHTNADRVIGHFTIGSTGKTDLALIQDATHLVVLEAKLYSGLSKGVKNAKYFDQASRNVACIAEVLRRANRKIDSFSALSFYVLAPKDQIESRTFSRHLDKQSIRDKINRQKKPYDRKLDGWFKEWFTPTLEIIDISSISWEEVLDVVNENGSRTDCSLKRILLTLLDFQFLKLRYIYQLNTSQ